MDYNDFVARACIHQLLRGLNSEKKMTITGLAWLPVTEERLP